MTLPEQFWEELPHRSDLELYEMLVQPAVYLPEAAAAASEELGRRGKLTRESLAELAAAAAQARELAKQIQARDERVHRLASAVCHIFGFLGHGFLGH